MGSPVNEEKKDPDKQIAQQSGLGPCKPRFQSGEGRDVSRAHRHAWKSGEEVKGVEKPRSHVLCGSLSEQQRERGQFHCDHHDLLTPTPLYWSWALPKTVLRVPMTPAEEIGLLPSPLAFSFPQGPSFTAICHPPS